MQQQQSVSVARNAVGKGEDLGKVVVLRTPAALIADARSNGGKVRISPQEAVQFEGRTDVRLVVLAVDDQRAGWWLLVQ